MDNGRTVPARGPGATFQAPAGTYNSAGGSTSALSFMLNGLLDFGEDDGIQGFIGGGVGVACRVQLTLVSKGLPCASSVHLALGARVSVHARRCRDTCACKYGKLLPFPKLGCKRAPLASK